VSVGGMVGMVEKKPSKIDVILSAGRRHGCAKRGHDRFALVFCDWGGVLEGRGGAILWGKTTHGYVLEVKFSLFGEKDATTNSKRPSLRILTAPKKVPRSKSSTDPGTRPSKMKRTKRETARR